MLNEQPAIGNNPGLMSNWDLIVAFIFACGVTIAVPFSLRWRIDRRMERSPVSEKLLRPAGESLRVKVDELNTKLDEAVFQQVAAPMGVVACLFIAKMQGLKPAALGLVLPLLIAVPAFVWAAVRLSRLMKLLRDYRLGFHGERAVAEELNQLMRDGCWVFHDLPMDPYGNIDHVVVAPSGVYAIETKTRRKRKAPPGKKDHVVFYDGEVLEYPHCRDSYGIQQARQQAERLRALLSKAVGEAVKVTPVLTLPGWFITCRTRPDFPIVSPKVIKSIVTSESVPLLSEQLMQRIAHQLDQKCRDVEL